MRASACHEGFLPFLLEDEIKFGQAKEENLWLITAAARREK